jgi:hypothetical protein
MHRAAIAALAILIAVPAAAEMESCRGYPVAVRLKIKRDVESLRMIEREAADRLLGLDTRTFDHLLGTARTAADSIADEKALAEDEKRKDCGDKARPIRSLCREAAVALAGVLLEQSSGAATKPSRQRYAEAMPKCESALELVPLSTPLRVFD